MRCDEVIHELATAGGLGDGRGPGPRSSALAEHLARCPRCADWARRDARLGRIWEATRPEEPGPAAWAAAWAAASRAADAATRGAPSRALSRPRPWRRLAWGAVAVAQAAVLLVATWLVFTAQPDPGRPRPRALPENALARKSEAEIPDLEPAPAIAPAADPALARAVPGDKVEIESGVTALIRSDGTKVEVVSVALDEGFGYGSGAVDNLYVWYNEQEAGAQ